MATKKNPRAVPKPKATATEESGSANKETPCEDLLKSCEENRHNLSQRLEQSLDEYQKLQKELELKNEQLSNAVEEATELRKQLEACINQDTPGKEAAEAGEVPLTVDTLRLFVEKAYSIKKTTENRRVIVFIKKMNSDIIPSWDYIQKTWGDLVD